MSETKFISGSMMAALIIMNGQKRIETAYGPKTAAGLADLIDRQTAAPRLLDACIKARAQLGDLVREEKATEADEQAYNELREIIAVAAGPEA